MQNIKKLDIVKSLWNALAINTGMFAAIMANTENLTNIVFHSENVTFIPWIYTL